MNQEKIIHCERGQRLWDIFKEKCELEENSSDAYLRYAAHVHICKICAGGVL